jgi:hypothetical protein
MTWGLSYEFWQRLFCNLPAIDLGSCRQLMLVGPSQSIDENIRFSNIGRIGCRRQERCKSRR